MSTMLRDTLYRLPRQPGLQLLQRRGDGGARELTSWRLRLSPGTEQRFSAQAEESVLIVQHGAASIVAGARTFDVSRVDVFEERASAVYTPPGEPLTITARSESTISDIGKEHSPRCFRSTSTSGTGPSRKAS